jgi:adenylosuccinate lyase
MIPNVLAERYASSPIRDLWSSHGKVLLERDLWIAVMKAQRDLGLAIPDEAIAAYEAARGDVNLPSIAAREKVTRHDVKARIDEFCELAGHEHIHKGMTSRDLTENVEQLQVYKSLLVIRDKVIAALSLMADRATEYAGVALTARTHNVAAQLTTMGKRFAMWGEELLYSFERLEETIATYPVRGLKGAVGTRLDQISLFGGDLGKASALEQKILLHLGLPRTFDSVGQVYPRHLDFHVVSLLCELGSGPSNFARTLRLMAGHELAGEGFAKGQTGSSAMPHKMNSRSCERINGFHVLLKGYVTMAAALSGDQWNEGDVSCSVVRRVMLPDAFFAFDGLMETLLTILSQMEIYHEVIRTEVDRYLPFLLTTTVLMEAIKAGAGREEAHEAIKEHALEALGRTRRGETNDLIARLAHDPRLHLDEDRLLALLGDASGKTGAAGDQVVAFTERVAGLVRANPKAAAYQPGVIL